MKKRANPTQNFGIGRSSKATQITPTFSTSSDPHLTKDVVYRGTQFEDGVAIQPATEEKAA